MNWKIVFLAILLLSAVAVTIGVTTLSVKILTIFGASFHKVYLDEPITLRPIDDDPGG